MKGIAVIRMLFGSLAIASLAAIVWFIGYVDRPEIRYATLPCHYDKIYRQEGPVDVLIFGSSRAMQGISPEVVAEVLSSPDKPAIALNLARSWRGNGQLFREFLDATENLGVRRSVVVELSQFQYDTNYTTTYYAGYYPNYEAVVPSADFISDWRSKPREPTYGLLRDFMGQYLTKLDKNLQLLLTGKIWATAKGDAGPNKPATSSSCRSGDNPVKPTVLQKIDKSLASNPKGWQGQKLISWNFLDINEDRPGHYIRKFKQLAAALGIDVYFTIVPRYLEPPTDPDFIARWQKHFGIRLLSPPVEVMEKMYDGGYADKTHMIAKGRDIYSKWLASQIASKSGQLAGTGN